MDVIVSFIENISNWFANTLSNFHMMLNLISESLQNANLLAFSNLLPSFLVSSVSAVIFINVVKCIVTIGGHHE